MNHDEMPVEIEAAEPETPEQTEPRIKVFERATANRMIITPEIAREWLAHNLRNRNQRPQGYTAYGRDMKGGDWLLNGDTIKFDWYGDLMDGQHRLIACAVSDKSFESFVIWGLDPAAGPTIDTGMVRAFKDQLLMGEVKNAATVAALTRRVHRYLVGERINFSKGKWTMAELSRTLEEHPEILDCAAFTDPYAPGLKIARSSLALLYWLLHNANEEEAKSFITKLGTGAALDLSDPILVLRARLAKERENKRSDLETLVVWLGLYAWNAWMEGRSVGRLQLPKGSKGVVLKPEDFPVPRTERLVPRNLTRKNDAGKSEPSE